MSDVRQPSIDSSPSHRADVMAHLSLSTDTNVRAQLMTQIRAITNGNLLDISDKIKQILCERARDKIVNDRNLSGDDENDEISVLVGSAKGSVGLFGSRLQERMFE